jgi:hypothetical protein
MSELILTTFDWVPEPPRGTKKNLPNDVGSRQPGSSFRRLWLILRAG